MTPWEIKGRELATCNCDWGCPCQFNARPSKGSCEAVVGIQIDQGHYGQTRLDGLRSVGVFSWPGAIHEGHGKALVIVDARADPAQRDALLKILSGEDTEPGATIFNVFAATYEKMFDPLFKPIALEIDIEARRGRIEVDGAVEASAEPIRNPVTGREHRVRVELPHGFEYTIAEFASGSSRTQGPIALDQSDRHAHFCHLHMTNRGVVRGGATSSIP
jgi:hypothetical protein